MPPYISTRDGAVLLAVRVQPRASSNAIVGVHNSELKVRVTAPPVDAAANEAVVRLLADALDCPRSALAIVRGHASRSKVLAISGITAERAAARLAGHG